MRVLLVEEAEHTEVFPDCQLGVLEKGQKFQPNDGDTRIQEILQLWAILQSLLAGDRDAPRIVLFTLNCGGEWGLSSLFFFF